LLADGDPAQRNWEWHCLDRLVNPEMQILRPEGLTDNQAKAYYFSAATFRADGQRLYATGLDPVLRVWDTATGRLVSTMRERTRAPQIGMTFNPDGSRLAMGGFGLQLFDVPTGRAVLPNTFLRSVETASVAFSGDGRTLLLGGRQRSLVPRIESGR
jgi:WD40 repeat protein